MAAAKEIRDKIKSIRNTQKITKAMEMVAASKMRRAQERMRQARPYGEKARAICAHLARSNSEYRHPFLTPRPAVANAGLLVVCSDKGLCGGMNANILRLAMSRLGGWRDAGVGAKTAVFGAKAAAFFARVKGEVVSECVGYGDKPAAADLIGATKTMLDAYRAGEVDEVWLFYSRFVSAVKQEPTAERLLPAPKGAMRDGESAAHSWDYLYEPSAPAVVDLLLTRYVEGVIYQAVADNIACEQAARMVAMKAASDNAGALIDELQLAYNKSRQAAITQEIAEIVGGAAAV